MPAPTQIASSPFQTLWTTGATKTSAVGAVGVGDLIVVEGVSEDTANFTWPAAPTNTAGSPATITWTARGTVTAVSHCSAASYTGVVTVAGDLTVSVAVTGTTSATQNWGYQVLAFASANHGGVGLVPAGASGAASGPTLTQTWSALSLIACVNGDWTAGTHGPPRDYRVGVGAATEVNYSQNVGPGAYSTEAWYYASTGAGSNAVGITTPNMTWSLIAIEVLASTAAPAAPHTFNAIPFIGGML